jgi:hypothetical protein
MVPTGNKLHEKVNSLRPNWEEIQELAEALAVESNADKVATLAHRLLDTLDRLFQDR